MKLLSVIISLLFLVFPVVIFADSVQVYDTFDNPSLPGWMKVSGNWQVINGRLVQTDVNEKMAMITIPVHQSGKILYQFDFKYVKGAEDDYAGFGIHICVNNPSKKRSWGNGKSVLGWITWDPKHYGYPGLFVQVYKSDSSTDMVLFPELFPNPSPLVAGDMYPIRDEYLNPDYLNYTIPVKILIDTKTGKGKFYDPANPDKYYFSFDLGVPIGPGDYFSFRTNSVSVSIDNLKITEVY
ncbi:hypothetical protein J7L85_01170 [candidate division WOR-3 bacterium]|nr:hypothetical protein [candidate division WOR-3 bacterium]